MLQEDISREALDVLSYYNESNTELLELATTAKFPEVKAVYLRGILKMKTIGLIRHDRVLLYRSHDDFAKKGSSWIWS